MLQYPNIDPVIFKIGPLSLHWYGLAYAAGFISAYFLAARRVKRLLPDWTDQDVSGLVMHLVAGVVLGARLGYVLFYDFSWFLSHPWDIVAVWKGGMSFHGGLIGVIVGVWIFARRAKKSFLRATDLIAPLAPIGLFCGRIANFINGELWGRATTAPWGMVFPGAGPLPRHPSQLYEALLEGVVLFTVLWTYSRKLRSPGKASGLFLVLYGCFRFSVEFVRQPDAQLGFIAFGWLTMGQILCLPMILLGGYLLATAHRRAG
ncbi:MAG: phosphatidylglycerol---prolipoprotein diacylglyceryl transferase [Desulfovibrionales bacterium]|nr:phosphatidylglycerol---prolipoprotein diacylglyceryl transferase [Desulfovibrionales bacterium]